MATVIVKLNILQSGRVELERNSFVSTRRKVWNHRDLPTLISLSQSLDRPLRRKDDTVVFIGLSRVFGKNIVTVACHDKVDGRACLSSFKLGCDFELFAITHNVLSRFKSEASEGFLIEVVFKVRIFITVTRLTWAPHNFGFLFFLSFLVIFLVFVLSATFLSSLSFATRFVLWWGWWC